MIVLLMLNVGLLFIRTCIYCFFYSGRSSDHGNADECGCPV